MNTMTKTFWGMLAITGTVGLLTGGEAARAAESARPTNYIQAQAGGFFPASDLDDADFDAGFNGAFSYGHYLTDNLKIEGTLDMAGLERDASGTTTLAGHYDRDDQLSMAGILVALKGEYPLGPVDLFAGAGIGLYGVELRSEIDSQRFGSFDKDDSDTVFGAQLSLGGNYNITERFYVGAEGKYLWTEDADIAKSTLGVPVAYDGDLSGYSVAFTVGWRF